MVKPNWKKLTVIVLVTLGGLGVTVFAILVLALNGGLRGTLSNLKHAPDPQSASLAAARASAKTAIEAALQTTDKQSGFTVYSTSTHDRCYKGQNNYKIKDGYAYRCTYRQTRFYGFNGNFRAKMVNLEQTLLKAGWKSNESDTAPLEAIMKEYYDRYYGTTDPQILKNFGGKYLVSSLPTPSGYSLGDKTLELSYAEHDTKDLSQIEYAQNITRDTLFETYDKKDFQDVKTLFAEITGQDQFVVAVSVQKNYFQN